MKQSWYLVGILLHSEGGTQKRAAMHLAGCLPYRYFPASYAHAGWHRLQPFFQLPGRIFWERDRVEVELKPFNDRALNRDLEALCAKVAKVQPRLPDGRSLFFRIQGAAVIPLLDAQEAAVA